MQAWVVAGEGEPSAVLEPRAVPLPDPAPGLVRLRVAAAALGLPDVLMCRGTYPLTPPLPFTPGQEVVGTVTAVGPDVDPTLVGTRQMGIAAFYLGAGGLAEEALAAAATLYPAPDALDDVAAGGFHIPFQTAWNALVDRAALASGEDLVVLGAAGGSGAAAVLLGVALGARVIAVVGGPEKVAFCRALGAADVVDHRRRDVVEAIRTLTGGRGAGVVFDPVGGEAGEGIGRAVASEGRVLLVGFAAGRWPVHDPAGLVQRNSTVMGVYAGAYDRDHVLAAHAQLVELRASGRLGPMPTNVVAFDDVPAALDRLAARTALGKTVVELPAGRTSAVRHLPHADRDQGP